MALLAQIEATVTLTADLTPSVPLTFFVDDDDAFYADVSVTDAASAAFFQGANALGIGLSYDRSDGVMVQWPDREIVNEFTINESRDQFGDTMTFAVTEEKHSPFGGSVLRRRTNVLAEAVVGMPGRDYRAQLFNGFIADYDHSSPPAVSRVTCLDGAGRHAQKRAKDYVIPPNSGWTRLKITNDLLEIGEINAGAMDVGDDDGGIINKPYTIGDKPIIEWLRDFWRVRGRYVHFINDAFVIVAYDSTLPSVATIRPNNTIGGYSLTQAGTLDPNVYGVVSVSVTRQDSLVPGAPVVTLTTTEEVYKPVAASFEQNDGVVTENIIPTFAAFQVTHELRTSSQKLGTVEIRYEETERAMSARRAARVQLVGDPDDDGIVPVTGRVFIHPDGSTRAERSESLQVIRRLLRLKSLDVNHNVVDIREERRAPRSFRVATFTVTAGVDVPRGNTGAPVPLDDSGQGMLFGREFDDLPNLPGHPPELVLTHYNLAADDSIADETTTEYFPSVGQEVQRSHYPEAFGYGIDQRTYHAVPSDMYLSSLIVPGGEVGLYTGKRVTRKVYAAIDEDSYRATTTVLEDGATRPIVTTQVIVGDLPRPEKAEPTSSSQEISFKTEDAERIAYAGGEKIEIVEHNEFIQNDDEAEFYSRFLAREASAIVATFTVPFETQIHVFKNIVVDVPGSAIDSLTFGVTDVQRNAATFDEQVTAVYFSPEMSES